MPDRVFSGVLMDYIAGQLDGLLPAQEKPAQEIILRRIDFMPGHVARHQDSPKSTA